MPTSPPLAGAFFDAVFDGHDPEKEIIALCPILETGASWTEPLKKQRIHKAKKTYYFAPYTLKPSAWEERDGKQPKLRRRQEDIAYYYAIVLDDIGSKVEQEPPVAPTWRLETSPGNEQWGYLIEPEPDLARINGFLEALKAAKLSDTGALKVGQIFRPPGAWHYKHEMRACLNEWEPERFWSLEDLGEQLGITWAPIALGTPKGGGVIIPDGYVDPVHSWLVEQELVSEDNGEWLTVPCPWHTAHSNGNPAAGYSPMGRGGKYQGQRGFRCFHESCSNVTSKDFLRWVADNGGPRVTPTGVVGAAATSRVAFQNLFSELAREDLPDCRWKMQGGEWVPAGVQLATSLNVDWVIRALGIEARFNLVMGCTELIPPQRTQEGWYADLEDDFARSQAVFDLVLDTCLRLCITAKNDCIDLINRIGRDVLYNPAENWILSAPWDGQDRLEALMGTFELANPNDEATVRMYLHRWSKQVMEAIRGYRNRRAKDMVLTFTGPQGCGKTTWIESLLPGEWVHSGVSLHLGNGAGGDRDSVRKATGAPIVELGELDATFRRSDISQLKSYLSQTVDMYRPAYGRTEIRRPRCTAYAGSVNHENFLTDVTGNRRYLVVPVLKLNGFHAVDMQQYWAQISAEWEADSDYHMTGEFAAMQTAMNQRFVNPTEVDDCFWHYFGEILAGTYKGPTKAAAMTTTALAKLIGAPTNRPALSELLTLVSATTNQQRREIHGMRNAFLLRVPAGEHQVHTLSGLKLVDEDESDVGDFED